MPKKAPKITVNAEYVLDLRNRLSSAVYAEDTAALQQTVPANEFKQLLEAAVANLAQEPTLVEVSVKEGVRVVVVGDTHGQFLDVLQM
ncbi:serine/threonine-protein phosphatase [Haematococcus lacustris]|uniref:Serine/threonine-protein phosphatase n=1 Tax=Haematococcus lacustris TaxID=44745 RepID=A0A6A0A1X8_HAELA|nr:serine/threonine-protein phosphatase [Haematococcus lacustris]